MPGNGRAKRAASIDTVLTTAQIALERSRRSLASLPDEPDPDPAPDYTSNPADLSTTATRAALAAERVVRQTVDQGDDDESISPHEALWTHLKLSVANHFALYPGDRIEAVAARFGVAKNTLRKWMNADPEFREAFEDACNARLNDQWKAARSFLDGKTPEFMGQLYVTAMQQEDMRAKIAALRLIFEMQGMLSKQRPSQAPHIQNIHVQILAALRGTATVPDLLASPPAAISVQVESKAGD